MSPSTEKGRSSAPSLFFNNILLGNRKSLGKEPPCQTTTKLRGVADLLSQFDFNIINEGPGDFSTQHRKYTCEFSKPGIESFTTTYQSNPDVHGQPTATDVFAALASDALAVDGLLVDTFADELGFEKPSQAIRAYESCHKTLDWLKNDLQLMTSEISDIAGTLDNELGEVKEQVERYGAGGGFVYGKALSNGSSGIPINDCQLYGHGLPLVEFYDVSQDPAKFPEGQFVTRYYMSTLLGMDSIGDSIGEMSALGLDGGVPNWTIRGDDLQEVYAHLCAAREQLESYTECGTYKDYGFGFHAKEGSMSSYVIGEPVEEGWWVLVGNYDLTDSDSDYYISDDLLNELLSRHGYPSMDALKESQADMWRNELTAIIAEAQEDSRFEVPFHLSSDESMLRHIVKRMGVPEEAARTAVANARAMYEKDAPRREPEKVVTLKGEVDKARRASAKLADNGNHSNRGQNAR